MLEVTSKAQPPAIIAPQNGTVVTVRVDGDQVHATVRLSVAPLGRHLPRVEVSGDAVADLEPGVAGTP